MDVLQRAVGQSNVIFRQPVKDCEDLMFASNVAHRSLIGCSFPFITSRFY